VSLKYEPASEPLQRVRHLPRPSPVIYVYSIEIYVYSIEIYVYSIEIYVYSIESRLIMRVRYDTFVYDCVYEQGACI